MGNQINLQEARFRLVPLGESADRNLLFEQRTCPGRRKAMGMSVAMSLEETICGGRTHREKQTPMFSLSCTCPSSSRVLRMSGKNGIKRFVQIRLSVFQASTNASSTSGP